jgi:ubiquinone/menaquinone biosynthesis C-methylase UbiE
MPLAGELWSTRPTIGLSSWSRRCDVVRRDHRSNPPAVRLLDAGCGQGCSAGSRARGATVFGIDAAPALLDIARERVPLGTFDLGDVGNLPYADATFDVVTGINSFQYVSVRSRRCAKSSASPSRTHKW